MAITHLEIAVKQCESMLKDLTRDSRMAGSPALNKLVAFIVELEAEISRRLEE